MDKQDTLISKKRRGPAPTGQGTPVLVRLQPDQLASIDAFIANEPDTPNRPEALRRLAALNLRDDAVTVYLFRIYDGQRGETVIAKRWATAEGLRRIGGEALIGSGVVVSRRELDPIEPDLSPIGWMPSKSAS